MNSFLIFLLGVVAGVCATMVFKLSIAATGQFLVDSSDEEKDIFRLNLDNLDDVYKKKVIELKIVRNADLSHE